jgi:hypothetical protein
VPLLAGVVFQKVVQREKKQYVGAHRPYAGGNSRISHSFVHRFPLLSLSLGMHPDLFFRFCSNFDVILLKLAL